jgi:hypothetical protein
MSACSCSFDFECIGSMVRGPHIARMAGKLCDNCGVEVRSGQRCVDSFGLYGDGGGWNIRFHAECFELMTRFVGKVCGYPEEWTSPFDLEEASQHAMAHGDDPFWRDWLLLYEQTWERP